MERHTKKIYVGFGSDDLDKDIAGLNAFEDASNQIKNDESIPNCYIPTKEEKVFEHPFWDDKPWV